MAPSPRADRQPVPQLPQATVERSALLHAWLPLRQRRCHLVLGPAGSGKTTLALQWRRQLVALGWRVGWVSAQADDDLDTLGTRLMAACGDTAAPPPTQHPGQHPSQHPARLAAALIASIATQGQDTLLVLDDYHHLGQAQVQARVQTLVQALLDYAPAHLHLLIVSRAEPALALARLRAQGQLHLVDAPALAFRLDEALTLARQHAPALSAEAVAHLHARSEGWAVGLRMLLHAAARQPAPLADDTRLPRPIAAYLQREVFFDLTPPDLHALVRLAPARRFNTALASQVLGAEASQHLVQQLRRQRLFITPDLSAEASGGGWWRFHPLLRALLLERFAQVPPEPRQALRLLIAQRLQASGQWPEATALRVEAGEAHAAADALAQHADALFQQGALHSLLAALARLPEALLAQHPGLATWRAWSLLARGQHAACAQALAVLEGLNPAAAATSPADHAAMLCLLRGALALHTDDLAAAQAVLPPLLELRDRSQPMLQGGRRHLLAWTFLHQGMPEEARRRLQSPPQHLPDGRELQDSPFGSAMGQALLGLSWLLQGEHRQAEAVLRHGHAQALHTLGPDSLAASSSAGLLAEVLVETGDPAGAQALLARHGHAIARAGLPDVVLSAALAQSRLRMLADDAPGAQAALAPLLKRAQTLPMPRLAAVLGHERFFLALQTRDEAAAQHALQGLDALAEQALRRYDPAAAQIAQWALLAQARWHGHRLQSEPAMACVRQLESQALVSGGLRVHTGALMAVLLQRRGQRPLALQQALQVAQQAQTAGLQHSVLGQGPEFLQLLRGVRRLGLAEHDPLLGLYLDRLLALAAPPPEASSDLGPAASAGAATALSARERQILTLLLQDLPNRRLAEALGVSIETIRWHLKNTFAKLGVQHRREAMAAARRLGLGDDGA